MTTTFKKNMPMTTTFNKYASDGSLIINDWHVLHIFSNSRKNISKTITREARREKKVLQRAMGVELIG